MHIKMTYYNYMDGKYDLQKIFGAAVAELRTQKGMTQEQLAEALSLSTHTITRIETGKAFASSKVISLMCDVFDISPSVLFTPKPHILYEEHINYTREITKLLPSFKSDRLKEIYNFLVVMNK